MGLPECCTLILCFKIKLLFLGKSCCFRIVYLWQIRCGALTGIAAQNIEQCKTIDSLVKLDRKIVAQKKSFSSDERLYGKYMLI